MENLILSPLIHQEIQSWYTGDFSVDFIPQERKPLSCIQRLLDSGHYELLGLFHSSDDPYSRKMLGYAAVWKAPDTSLLLLDYLGISSPLRNQGLGSRILSLLGSLYDGKSMVVEAELPVSEGTPEENSLRLRRIKFYERNGFLPVYKMAACGMHWQVLLLGNINITDKQTMAQIIWEHKKLYGSERTDVRIPVIPGETPAMPYWMKEQM